MISPLFRRFTFLLLLVGIAVLAWYPIGLSLGQPSADQVWESFGIGATCSSARYELGWTGTDPATASSGALFTASLAAVWMARVACNLAIAAQLSPLQGYLVVGLSFTFALAAITSRLHGFRPANALLVGFLICTAPFCFSRVGHLSLATAWAVVPGLLACHGLWRAMGTAQPLWRPALAGALASALCLPTQDYYVSFTLLLGLSTFALLLLIASTRDTALLPLTAAATRGLCFGVGFGLVLLVLFSGKLSAVLAGGGGGLPSPPPLWSSPRHASEQFRYGLLPYTWLVPSPWQASVQAGLAAAGIPLNSEAHLWSTGSLLIPVGWVVAIRRLARLRHAQPDDPCSRDRAFFALLLLLCTALGLLVMTMGGLGTVFAAFVSPVLRSLNRFTVFVYGAAVLLLVSELQAWLQLRPPGDRRGLLWGLLGFWAGVELLFSSRWWPPMALPASPGVVRPASGSLQALLAQANQGASRPLRVWFAPYTTYPETGFVESAARRGVYDTFLALPANGLASNYGAGKLSPADVLFSQAAAGGLLAEWRLARALGYDRFAIDLGAVNLPERVVGFCRRTAGCELSADAYALLPLAAPGPPLEAMLNGVERQIPLLPFKSAGSSWGTVVFSPFQWTEPETLPDPQRADGTRLLRVQALPLPVLEIYRHPLEAFPAALRPALQRSSASVRLELAPEVLAASVCIGPEPCRPLLLGPGQRSLEIGPLLAPGRVTRLSLRALQGGAPDRPPLRITVGGQAALPRP